MDKKKFVLRTVSYIPAIIIFICGLMVFIYPFVNRALTEHYSEQTLETFNSIRTIKDTENENKDSDTAIKPNSEDEKMSDADLHKFDALYSAMQQYNTKIFAEHQSELKDAWSYENVSIDLSQYGIYDSVIGEIRIPAMNCDLPLYLGATRSNMAWGAVHLEQTSMPIGGENTNCVIAGHRGCTNGRYFLDIENMKLGDMVYIDNLWGTLTYEVSKIDVIAPTDIDKILIQEGKDMVTLITCHPYPYNYQRYVVYCERVTDVSTDSLEISVQDFSTEPDNTESPENTENTANLPDLSQTSIDDGGSSVFISFEDKLFFIIPIILGLLAIAMYILTKTKKRQ